MFYRFAWILCRIYLKVFRRWKVYGLENIPEDGGILVAANHTSYLDPVAVGCALHRKVSYMGKVELFRIPVLKQIITALGTFPVNREGVDREAIRTALSYLKRGKAVGIFPEGTRSRDGGMLKPQLGTAMLALKADVPIIPVAITGTRGFIGQVRISFGRPLVFPEHRGTKPSRAVLEEISDLIMTRIEEMSKTMR